MSKYQDLEEKMMESKLDFQPEYRLFASVVGDGPGVRNRLKESGLSDFRYDYWVKPDLLVEIQGYGFSHQGRGQQRDYKKCNDAVKYGYRVIYFPAELAKKRPDLVTEEIIECLNAKRV